MDGTETVFMGMEEREEQDIRQGDIVMLDPTATYYDGRIIPSWVKQDQWIVCKVEGDRVVINENTRHTNAILSPVRMKYLRKV